MGPEPASTVLTGAEEAIAVAFRRHTLLPLDDCLYALQATIPRLSRSALHRCFQRHGISRLPLGEDGQRPPKKKFKDYPIGYLHVDFAEVQTEQGKQYLFVAIDRTSKVAFAERHPRAKRVVAAEFLRRVLDGSLHKAPLGGEINSPPTDRAKGGVKCSRLTEAWGIPVGLVLDGANRHDVKLVDRTLVSLPPVAEAARNAHRAAGGEQGLCRNVSYDVKQVRETLTALDDTARIRSRGAEVQVEKASQKARR